MKALASIGTDFPAMNHPALLQEMEWDAVRLAADFPPVWRHAHKQAVHKRVLQEGGPAQGNVRLTRWSMAPLPEEVRLGACAVTAEPGFFTYRTSNAGVWHLNFADPRLFAAYGSPLMAQDEWQVLEHPLLGSIREALLHGDLPALTRADGVSTPVLVAHVPRQCVLDLAGKAAPARSGWRAWLGGAAHDAAASARPLYGKAFREATQEQVLRAVNVMKPAATSNILAISAPTGTGAYTLRQITDILQTAYNGFAAARLESQRGQVPANDVEIHTGWWGCGAFGGNQTLMALLQILAANMAGIGRLILHYGDEGGRAPFDEAIAFLDLVTEGGLRTATSSVLDEVEALRFRWGRSDGN